MGQPKKPHNPEFSEKTVAYPLSDTKELIHTVLTTANITTSSILESMILKNFGVTVAAEKKPFKDFDEYKPKKAELDGQHEKILQDIENHQQAVEAIKTEEAALAEELKTLEDNPNFVALQRMNANIKALQSTLSVTHKKVKQEQYETQLGDTQEGIDNFKDTKTLEAFLEYERKADDLGKRKEPIEARRLELQKSAEKSRRDIDNLISEGNKDRIAHYGLVGPEPYVTHAAEFLSDVIKIASDFVSADGHGHGKKKTAPTATTARGASHIRQDQGFNIRLQASLKAHIEKSRDLMMSNEFNAAVMIEYMAIKTRRELAIMRCLLHPDNIKDLIDDKETRRRFKKTKFWELLWPQEVEANERQLAPDLKITPDLITEYLTEDLPAGDDDARMNVAGVLKTIGLLKYMSLNLVAGHIAAEKPEIKDPTPNDDSDPPMQAVSSGSGIVEIRAVAPMARTKEARHKAEIKIEKFVPRSPEQALFAFSIDDHLLTVGAGASGGGKTHVALYKMLERYKNGLTPNITVVRPLTTTTGHDIGALPGDLELKTAPWFKALNKTIMQVTGGATLQTLIARGIIKLQLAEHVRGETFEGDVIVDEAQNFSHRVLNDLLVRVPGENKVIITGDIANQIDMDTSDQVPGLLYDILTFGQIKLSGELPQREPLSDKKPAAIPRVEEQRRRQLELAEKRTLDAIKAINFVDFGPETATARGQLAAMVQSMDMVARSHNLVPKLTDAFEPEAQRRARALAEQVDAAQGILFGLQDANLLRYWQKCREHYGKEMFPDELKPVEAPAPS